MIRAGFELLITLLERRAKLSRFISSVFRYHQWLRREAKCSESGLSGHVCTIVQWTFKILLHRVNQCYSFQRVQRHIIALILMLCFITNEAINMSKFISTFYSIKLLLLGERQGERSTCINLPMKPVCSLHKLLRCI
jgi:hypothetical protein